MPVKEEEEDMSAKLLLASIKHNPARSKSASFYATRDSKSEAVKATCYLLFNEASGGSFKMQWSSEPSWPGALASFAPRAGTVPMHKLQTHGGLYELCRGVHNPKQFFTGWCNFLKQAHANKAKDFTHLANVDKSGLSAAVYVNDKDSHVQRLSIGTPICLDDHLAVAVVHEQSRAFQDGRAVVRVMGISMFVSAGNIAGAATALGIGVGSQLDAQMPAMPQLVKAGSRRRSTEAETAKAVSRTTSAPEREGVSGAMRILSVATLIVSVALLIPQVQQHSS